MGIVEFIAARIREDEARAMAAAESLPPGEHDGGEGSPHDALGQFLIQWNPWHVMSLCVLRRHAVQMHSPVVSDLGSLTCATCDARRGQPGWPCRSLVLVANEWVEHPDFRPEWSLTRARRLLRVV